MFKAKFNYYISLVFTLTHFDHSFDHLLITFTLLHNYLLKLLITFTCYNYSLQLPVTFTYLLSGILTLYLFILTVLIHLITFHYLF